MNNSETWYKDLFIDNIKVAFKIDTGANINVLPLKCININSQQKIEHTKIKLYVFGGTCIEGIGKINLS